MKSRSRILNLFVGFGSLVLIGDAVGETYTWTGGAGNLVGWSNPLNWAGGLVPVSATDSTIINARGYQNISPEFDVGTLRNPYFEAGAIRVHQSIVSNYYFVGEILHIGASVSTVGNVSLVEEVSTLPPVGISRVGSMLSGLTIGGSLELSGGWRVDYLQGHGSIHLNSNASLDAWATNPSLIHSQAQAGSTLRTRLKWLAACLPI